MKLRDPIEQLLREDRPDCLVTDMFYPWTAHIANGLGIPRIVFHGTGCFSLCAQESVRRYAPHEKAVSDTEAFLLPGLPDNIEFKSSTLPDYNKTQTGFALFLKMVLESELKSYGVVVNSFHELEPAYADYYKKEMGRKAWHIGPVSLCNRNMDKIERGLSLKPSIDEHSCLSWLDSKEPDSVLYVCFGSFPRIAPAQLLEVASGLEASDHPFIWVVGKILRSSEGKPEETEDWLPLGFEERLMSTKRGLVIRGWAPQLLILEHAAVGGYMTHCGWNSSIEGVTAGVPMITWPLSSEQFYNVKFIVDVIKVWIPVGNEEWVSWHAEPRVTVKREKVTMAVNRLMGGNNEVEVVEMRKRAKEFGEKAKRAVKEGGSSYVNVDSFIEELESRRQRNGLEPAGAAEIKNESLASVVL